MNEQPTPPIYRLTVYEVEGRTFIERQEVFLGTFVPGELSYSTQDSINLRVIDDKGRMSEQPHTYNVLIAGASTIFEAVAAFDDVCRQKGAEAEIVRLKKSQLGQLGGFSKN